MRFGSLHISTSTSGLALRLTTLAVVALAGTACSESTSPPAEAVRRDDGAGDGALRALGEARVLFTTESGRLLGAATEGTARLPRTPTASDVASLRQALEQGGDALPASVRRRGLQLVAALERSAAPADLRPLLRGREHIRHSRNRGTWQLSGRRGPLVTVENADGAGSSTFVECSVAIIVPEECYDYDPNFDPIPPMTDLAAMQGEVGAGLEVVTAIEAEVLGSAGPSAEPCRVERLAYNQAVYEFLIAAGTTVVGIIRKSPRAAGGGLLATSFALFHVNVALAKYQQCLDEQRQKKGIR